MSAQRIRLLVFSLLTVIGIYTPWIKFKGGLGALAKAMGLDVDTGIRHFFMGIVVIVVIMVLTGDRTKPLGIVKKIFNTLFGLLIMGMAFKYIGDASSKISSPGFGLYIMALGGTLIIIGSYIPENKLPCLLGKFVKKPAEDTPVVTGSGDTPKE